ncbi:gluconate 5-dehydrogenase [Cadophora sp. DSE1049]|nr:gluconate 5-dehydrogenase [Cadophora sp. DSE1049]
MPLHEPDTTSPVLSLFSLAGKVCVVTGAARGIGLEVARGMAEAGADVAIVYCTSVQAPDIAHKVARETGRRIETFTADVKDRTSIAAAMKAIKVAFGKIDIVVANAGVCRQISSLDYDEKTWAEDYLVNVDGAMWTAQAAGRIFKDQGFGNLIITASVSSILVNIPQPQTSYNSSKAAAAVIAKNLAVEWIDFARVNAVSPGYVATNMTLSQPAEIRGEWTGMIPARRMAQPTELKGLYVFLASDASSYMTGANVICDGGFSLV